MFLVPVIMWLGIFASERLPHSRFNELLNHMTDDERSRFMRFRVKYSGIICLCFFLCWMAADFFFLAVLEVDAISYYVVLFIVLAPIAGFIGLRAYKAEIRLVLSTKYAQEQGWTRADLFKRRDIVHEEQAGNDES